MFKTSVPISMSTINEKTLPTYIDYVKKCDIKRVFICGMGEIYDQNSRIYTESERIINTINAFRECGIEVGVWCNTLGHGAALVGANVWHNDGRYASMEGVGGDKPPHAICPADENFLEDFAKGIATVASFAPDIIMLDDDFRIGRYQYYFGCFCPKHLARFYELVGEEVPRDEIEAKVYTGGKNKYRDAYRQMIGETMMNFARRMRDAVNSVDSNIRLGLAGALENWDADGLELPELARAFAGDTKPFFRTHGAPYWSTDIMKIIESTRMQNKWLSDAGIDDMMGEGDTYPRPRYNVPFKTLELFNYALIADEYSKGMLAYIVDYGREPEYETGYVDKFVKCRPQCQAVEAIFDGKKAVGVTVINKMHTIENWELPSKTINGIAQKMHSAVQPACISVLAKNSIPTSWNENGFPVLLMGESARTVDAEQLKNGAILDVVSAKILSERGIDVGLVSFEKASFTGECYEAHQSRIPNVGGDGLYKIECKADAKILSCFEPDGSPSSYLYENADGQRFNVIAFEQFSFYTQSNIVSGSPMFNFLNNYYRQEDLINAIEWMCGKSLPAKSRKNPNLYIYTAKDECAMSVLLLNIHLDSIDEPVVELDREYSEIKCINCTGGIDGNKVYLSGIEGYGMAAFEVR